MLRSIFLLLLGLGVLTAVLADVDVPPASSFWVPSLPDIHQDPSHPLHIYAGHLSSDPKAANAAPNQVTGKIYFVLVKNRRIADKDRVIFWFNGGPGCSSFDGLMMEVGPWRTNFHGGFNLTEGGWEEYTNMVYVDQPVGTGFSYTSTNSYVKSMSEAIEQWLEFLRNFYRVFPEFEHMDTYLGGESWAGQYIPYFADAVLESKLPTKLRGAAIGNGWMDGRRQYPAYLDFAVKVNLLEENSDVWKEAKKTRDACVAAYDAIKPGEVELVNMKACAPLIMQVAKKREKIVDGKQMCINVYDIRGDDISPKCGLNWPPDIKHITDYLDRSDVVKALHAEAHPQPWKECRPVIRTNINSHPINSSVTVLPRVLAKIPVLIFAGDQDLICNYVGIEAMIKSLTWNGITGLGTVETQPWTVGGQPAGTWVSSRNLTYAKIFNASHMAPYDAPHVAHDMILRFMGVNFSSIVGGSAKIPSSIGTVAKPVFVASATGTPTPTPPPAKNPQQDKAMWEAYYNAGSAALVLLLVVLVIALFLWCRVRRRRSLSLPEQQDEEAIPLASRMEAGEDQVFRPRKGKERASRGGSAHEPPIFDVGDGSDDEDDEAKVREKYKDGPSL